MEIEISVQLSPNGIEPPTAVMRVGVNARMGD